MLRSVVGRIYYVSTFLSCSLNADKLNDVKPEYFRSIIILYRVLKIKPTLVGQQSTGKRRLMEDTKQPEPSISFSARQCARLRLQTTNWPSCLLVVVISLREPEPGLAPHLAAGCWPHVYVVFYCRRHWRGHRLTAATVNAARRNDKVACSSLLFRCLRMPLLPHPIHSG
jgi:hypothetical protein